MCPPVMVRTSREGMTYLYDSWLYELKHGSQLEICFTCFKFAFLDLKDMLESEDWEDEEWDPMELDEGEHEPAASLMPPSVGTEEEYLDDPMVPTELEPQITVGLGLGSDHADWTQALPWRFDGLLACNHWPSSPPPKPVPRMVPTPVTPMLLELGTLWPMEPAEAQAWLLSLQIFCVVGYQDSTIYLRKMTPLQALKSLGQRWKVLLEPSEIQMEKLEEITQPLDLLRHQLSILEKTQQGEQLFAANMILQKKGFNIISFSPWCMNEEHSACASCFPTSGQQPGPLDISSHEEHPAVMGLLAPEEFCFRAFGPEPEN